MFRVFQLNLRIEGAILEKKISNDQPFGYIWHANMQALFLDRMNLVCIFKEAVLEFVHFLYVSRIKSSILINQKSISFFHKWVNIIKLHFKVQWYRFLVHREE